MAAGYDAGHEEADDSGAESLICSESDGAGSENSWEEVAAAPPAAKGGGRGGGKGGGTGRGRGRGGGRGRGRSGSPAAADGGEKPAAALELTAAAVRGRAMGVRRSDGSRALTARGLEADGAKGVLKERLLQAIAPRDGGDAGGAGDAGPAARQTKYRWVDADQHTFTPRLKYGGSEVPVLGSEFGHLDVDSTYAEWFQMFDAPDDEYMEVAAVVAAAAAAAAEASAAAPAPATAAARKG